MPQISWVQTSIIDSIRVLLYTFVQVRFFLRVQDEIMWGVSKHCDGVSKLIETNHWDDPHMLVVFHPSHPTCSCVAANGTIKWCNFKNVMILQKSLWWKFIVLQWSTLALISGWFYSDYRDAVCPLEATVSLTLMLQSGFAFGDPGVWHTPALVPCAWGPFVCRPGVFYKMK